MLTGVEINRDSHGIAAFGLRRGPVALQLNTDTLALIVQDEGDKGRWWAQLKGQGAAAGMFPFVWTNGAKDPASSFLAFTGGVEGGGVAYLGHGLYGGGWLGAQYWAFRATADTTAALPDARPVLTGRAVGGYWSEPFAVDVQGGVSLDGATWIPQISAVAAVRTPWVSRPLLEVRSGFSANATPITRTRLGGLNPYVIPLAGAAWAEFHVDNYVAGRVGPGIQINHTNAAVFADVAWFDGRSALGFRASGTQVMGPWTFSLMGGLSPGLSRPTGMASSVYVSVAHEWRAFRGSSEE